MFMERFHIFREKLLNKLRLTRFLAETWQWGNLARALPGYTHKQRTIFPMRPSDPPRPLPPSPIPPVFTLQPFSGAISKDNGAHKSSGGQWSPWNWCAFISKQWRCLMRRPHDVITSVADRARAGVFWPQDGHRANENSGQLNQSAVSNEVAGPWCKQPPDTLHHALRTERNRQLLLRKSKASLSPYSWVMPHCLSVGIAPQFPVQTIRAINNSGTIKSEIGWKKKNMRPKRNISATLPLSHRGAWCQ